MGRPQSLNPEQQRADEARERATLINKLNVAIESIAAAQKRIDEADTRIAKILNDARSEKGTAESELCRELSTYSSLRARLDALLPPVSAVETEQREESAHA